MQIRLNNLDSQQMLEISFHLDITEISFHLDITEALMDLWIWEMGQAIGPISLTQHVLVFKSDQLLGLQGVTWERNVTAED